MTTSKRLAERKIAKFEKNITKKGSGGSSFWKKLTTENIILAFFAFVVVGSYNPACIDGIAEGNGWLLLASLVMIG